MPHATPYRTSLLPAAEFQPPGISAAALAVLAAGAATLAVTGALVASGRELTRTVDRPVQRRLRRRGFVRHPKDQPPGATLAKGIGGKWTSIAAAAVGAAFVARRRGPRAALPPLASVGATLGLHAVMKEAIGRPRPLMARLTGKRTPSFPSGHAARAAGVFGTLAHIAEREGLAPAAVAYPLAAAAAVASGASRVAQDRHWTTDIVGGLGLGAAVAAACALWYDADARHR